MTQPIACALLLCAALTLAPATASACLQYRETFDAEAYALPCVLDALLGTFPSHSLEYHETQLAAADLALAWAPGWTEALDLETATLIKLGRLEEARASLALRARLEPDSYETHAHLGTLYTFTAELEAALEHIDRALELRPDAHYGRELYHRQLLDWLARSANDPDSVDPLNFLDLHLHQKERLQGSERR